MKANKKRRSLYDYYSQIVFDLIIVILAIIAFFIWAITLLDILIEGVFHQVNKKSNKYINIIF